MRDTVMRVRSSVDLPVLVIAFFFVAGGYVYAHSSVPPARVTRAFGGELRVTLPAGWSGARHGNAYIVTQPRLDGMSPTLLIESIEPPEGGPDPMWVDLTLARIEQSTQSSGVGYRVLSSDSKLAFGNHPATLTYHALVKDPPGTAPGAAVLPVVVEGIDALVTTAAGRAWRVSAEAPLGQRQDLDRVLDSVRFSP
jgi:hypothetical protein